jgi:signal transduction histidine kinase
MVSERRCTVKSNIVLKKLFHSETAKNIVAEPHTSLFHAFFNSLPQYQVLLNDQLEIVAFNDYAFTYTKTYIQLDLANGRSMLDYIHRSFVADFKTICENALRGEQVSYEHFIAGTWFDFTITPLYNCNQSIQGLALVGNNIDQHKKNVTIIKHQSACLSGIAQLQAHQVRHPVSSILSLVKLLKEEQDYQLTKEYLQGLETAATQLDDVIRAIIDKS